MNDFAPILDRIRQHPDHEPHWLALSAHLNDNGEYDLARVIQAHWPVCREIVRAGKSTEEALNRIRKIGGRGLARLAQKSREREERGLADRD
jgi:hypothetical protein